MATYIYTYDGNKYHYQGYVKDINGNSIWEAHYPEFIEDEKSGEVMETSNIFDEGVNNPEDIEGVENYLKSIGVLNQNDELVDESGYMGEGEEDEEYQEMAKGGLIASSKTLDGIKKIIEDYYYSSNISLKKLQDSNEYEVNNAKGKIDSVKVIEKNGRFQFISKSIMAKGGRAAEYETYHKTLASALREAQSFVENRGYEFSEETYFPDLTMGGVKYGETISSTRDIVEVGGKNRKNTLVIVVYRMDSGTYELTMYFTKSNYAEGGELENENLEMLENQIVQIKHHAEEIEDINNVEVDAWVIAKGQRAATDLSDITHYLDGKKAQQKMANGGAVSKEFYVEFTWSDADDESRSVYIKADTKEEAEEKAKQKFGKAYEGFKIIKIERSMKTGGKIETQSKNKLKATFELPLELVVYVPSTTTADMKISDEEFESRIDYVETYLSDLFGGYSATEVEGGYVSDEKGLIQEDVMKVTAFGQVDNFEDKFNQLLHQVKMWCEEWGQESIGFEFEGDLFYINKDSKFKDGGYMAKGGDIRIGTPLTEDNIDGAIIMNIEHPEWGTWTVLRKYDDRIWEIRGRSGVTTLFLNEFKFWKRINYADGGYMADGGGFNQYGEPYGFDRDEYDDMISEYDRLCAFYEDAESDSERARLSVKIDALEDKINAYERMEDGGETDEYAKGGEVRYKLKGTNFGQQIESGQKFKALILKAFENQSGEQKYPENFIKEIAYTGKIVKNEGSNFLKDYSYKGTLTKFEFLDDKDFVEALKYLDRPLIKSFKFADGGETDEYAKGGNVPSIERRVAEVNAMIEDANEKGLEVVDEGNTWQAPMKYKPIKYTRGVLYISYFQLDLYKYNKGIGVVWEKKNDVVGRNVIMYSQSQALSDIARMYRKVLKFYDKYGYKDGGDIEHEQSIVDITDFDANGDMKVDMA